MAEYTSDEKNRIRELTDLLNKADRAYYAEDAEIMDNLTYDRLKDELAELEEKTGIRFADSPSVRVGYQAVDELPKVQHERPMLSLDKTKDVEVLRSFVGDQKTLLSWKMDGLTIVLEYRAGELYRAVTRGDGHIGEEVTPNARVFKDLPQKIPFKGELVIRGEAYITYQDFEEINNNIEDAEAKYKNPRNLCSGSVRQLNNEITAKRNVRLKAFSLVRAEEGASEAVPAAEAPAVTDRSEAETSAGSVGFNNSHEKEFEWLSSMGFDVVEYRVVTSETLDEAIEYFRTAVSKVPFPSDGLVAMYDDIAYGDSLGSTAKFPRNSFAFKWADELRQTKFKMIEWSPSRTGLINPVAIFEPVELEGTTVSRASVHNVSILEELQLGAGDEILVYKANMIIPQISENLTKSGPDPIPDKCPACGGETVIKDENGVRTLACPNPDCPAKKLKSFALFAAREALNIEGMSEATLEKFIAHGLIHTYADLFRLTDHKEVITAMDGFGEKSFAKLKAAADKARKTTLARLLCGLGIPNIGVAAARLAAQHFDSDPLKVMNAGKEDLTQIDGFGDVIAETWVKWWENEKNRNDYLELSEVLEIEKPAKTGESKSLKGLTFVITGSLSRYSNRSELKEFIENAGGKVAGSVSSKTGFLINNDTASNSSKNRTAKELGIPIISEEEFIERFG